MTAAAYKVKEGVLEVAGRLEAGVSAVEGPTYGDAPPGEVIIVTLESCNPDDAGNGAGEVRQVREAYSSGRGQIWTSEYEIEFWGNTSAANFRRVVALGDALQATPVIGGVRVGWLPVAIGSEANTGSDSQAYILTAGFRCRHLATHTGGFIE